MSYYDRSTTLNLDGTPIFKTPEDEEHESAVAAKVETAWSCRLHSFGKLCPIDWWAERDGRMVGLLELKSRTHSSDTYPTVFLNVRKWLALTLAEVGLGVPAIFAVEFTDRLCYIPLSEVDGTQIAIGGTKHLVKSRSDIEPVVLVPIASMRDVLASPKETR